MATGLLVADESGHQPERASVRSPRVAIHKRNAPASIQLLLRHAEHAYNVAGTLPRAVARAMLRRRFAPQRESLIGRLRVSVRSAGVYFARRLTA